MAVAHQVEHRIVTPEVAGSRPVGHPIKSKTYEYIFNYFLTCLVALCLQNITPALGVVPLNAITKLSIGSDLTSIGHYVALLKLVSCVA